MCLTEGQVEPLHTAVVGQCDFLTSSTQTRTSSELVRNANAQPPSGPTETAAWNWTWDLFLLLLLFLNKTNRQKPAVNAEALASSIFGEPWNRETVAKLRTVRSTQWANLTEGSTLGWVVAFQNKAWASENTFSSTHFLCWSIHRKKNMDSQMITWSNETDKVLQNHQFCSFT